MQPTLSENNLIIGDTDFVRLMAINPPTDLRAELEKATVVPMDSIGANVVTIGSRVEFFDQKVSRSRQIEIVLPEEADVSKGKVSVVAPVGAALIGLSVGHEIEWDFPDGSVHRLTVVSVFQPPAVDPVVKN